MLHISHISQRASSPDDMVFVRLHRWKREVEILLPARLHSDSSLVDHSLTRHEGGKGVKEDSMRSLAWECLFRPRYQFLNTPTHVEAVKRPWFVPQV